MRVSLYRLRQALRENAQTPFLETTRDAAQFNQHSDHWLDLSQGDFLQGISLTDSAAFEEWVLVQREALRRQVLSALDTLSVYHEQRNDYEALCLAARQQLALEPLRTWRIFCVAGPIG